MRSRWMDPREARFPSLDADREVDIAIVGGGLSGLGAAYGLRESGARVALIEERTLASGASGRNAGFMVAGPASQYAEAVRTAGAAGVRLIWDFTRDNHALIAGLIEELGLDCGYLRRGSMALAMSEEEMALLEADHRSMIAANISTCLVNSGELPQPFDSMYAGGLYSPGNAELDPAAFVRGVAAHIADDVDIYEQTPVRAIREEGLWLLDTPGASVHATAVVLATNAYTPNLLPAVPITPTRGQVLSTAPLARVIVPFPMSADHGYQYWRQTPDGALVVGGWRNLAMAEEVGYEENLNPAIQQALDRFCEQIAGEGVRVEHRWAGIMGFTPDRLPLVGPLGDGSGLVLCAGFSGHGVSMAFACGMRAGWCAAGGHCEVPSPFSPDRHVAGGSKQ